MKSYSEKISSFWRFLIFFTKSRLNIYKNVGVRFNILVNILILSVRVPGIQKGSDNFQY